MFVAVARIHYFLKVLCLMKSIGIEKSIDTSGIDEKVLVIVSKSIFTVLPTTNARSIKESPGWIVIPLPRNLQGILSYDYNHHVKY